MPILSTIGRRSWKVRLLIGAIYAVLLVGSVTMIYPLLLMLAGSVKSEADAWSIKPYPEFWLSDRVLFQKYAESKYNNHSELAQNAWCRQVLSWRKIEPPPQIAADLLQDFREWRASLPPDGPVGHVESTGMLPQNLRSYRRYMARLFHDDLEAYNQAADAVWTSWTSVAYPEEVIGRYRNHNLPEDFRQELTRWKATLPLRDRVIHSSGSSRGEYAFDYLAGRYTSLIESYNQAHGTAYASYSGIPLPERVPPQPGLARADWTDYVRNRIALTDIRLDPALEPAFRAFLAARYASVALFNDEHGTSLATLAAVPFVERLDEAPWLRSAFEAFLQSSQYCPLESVRLVTTDSVFADYLVAKRGRLPDGYPGIGAVTAAADWADCMEHKTDIRWEMTIRNYVHVIDYLAMHGNGLANTAIYCSLAVLTALLVNPLAAYALSRFRLPGTYKILLFCMATMAFPGEVAMIPGFILLKRFPLWPILAGVAVTLGLFLLLERGLPRWPERWRALTALGAGLVTGVVIVPALVPGGPTVSLLNTFSALVLPGMANGYSIFLLKGFFDSMPKELYEAADLDGAGEWTKFWMLTMNLSRPILAVIALSAFTGAYSAFMMALIIIPDERMWTIMVWVFQFQTTAHPSVVYASLVVAAVPTFIIFVLCQNVIMRGIVVPTEK
jgi:ABC-type glycerol-3-phosphate transport system permease component